MGFFSPDPPKRPVDPQPSQSQVQRLTPAEAAMQFDNQVMHPAAKAAAQSLQDRRRNSGVGGGPNRNNTSQGR